MNARIDAATFGEWGPVRGQGIAGISSTSSRKWTTAEGELRGADARTRAVQHVDACRSPSTTPSQEARPTAACTTGPPRSRMHAARGQQALPRRHEQLPHHGGRHSRAPQCCRCCCRCRPQHSNVTALGCRRRRGSRWRTSSAYKRGTRAGEEAAKCLIEPGNVGGSPLCIE